MTDWIGWAATAVFTASYFCTRASALRRVQMAGAAMWIGYGVATGAMPVIAANLLVLAAAAVSAWRHRRDDGGIAGTGELAQGA